MLRRIRYQEIVYTRSLSLIIATMALFVVLNALLWFLSANNLNHLAKPLVFVSESLQLASLLFVFFLFLSYEMASKLRRTFALERLCIVKDELIKIYGSQFCLLLIPLLIVCLNIFFWFYTVLHLQGMSSGHVLRHLFLATLLYCFLPSCIAILFGILLSKHKRAIAYTLIVVATLIISPIPLRMFSDQQIGGVSFASILDWFSLSVPDSDWLPDSVYGIPMEAARWARVFFWVFLLLFMFIYQNSNQLKGVFRLFLFALAIIVLATGLCFMRRHNDSIVYKDSRSYGLQYDLSNYYKSKTLPAETQASFKVADYEMELTIRTNLNARVKMVVTGRTSNEPLLFTLQHGLKVKSVCDDEGNPLKYTRNIDYLTVDTDKTVIIITYSGIMGMFYSNNQAIFLPGYTAYYPIPGVHHLWDANVNTTKPILSTCVCHFRLKVNSFLDVFSNLHQVSRNTFAGESNSVGVFAGLLKKTEKEKVIYLESLVLNDSSRWSLSDYNESWNRISSFFELSENRTIEGRMIVFLPATILGFFCPSKYIDDGSIIYFGDLTPTPDMLACETFLKNVTETSQNTFLYSFFASRLYSGLEKKTGNNIEKPDYNDLLLFNKAINDFSEEEWHAFGTYMMLWEQLLAYQENILGTQVFLNNVYRYLQEPHPQQTILDFVYYMGAT